MKKSIAILAFFYFAVPGIKSQSEWNFLPGLSYPQAQITDMIVDDDNIIVYGDAFNNAIEWKQGLLIAKLDTIGTVLKEVFLLDSLGDKFAVDDLWGKIIPTSDGGYAATAATVSRESAFLIKLDHDLDVEFIREYPDTVNQSNFFYNLREVSGGYLLFGQVQLPNYQLVCFVKRTDQAGDILWERLYTNTNFPNNLLDLDVLNDSTFVFVTVELLEPLVTGGMPEDGRSGIYKIDGQGNVLAYYQTQAAPDIGYMRKVVALEDGSFITYGLARKDIYINTELVQPTLTRFDSTMTIQWSYSFGRITSLGGKHLLDFERLPDGNILGSGQFGVKNSEGLTRGQGWLYKFSPAGDSIWGRHFPPPFPDIESVTGTLFGSGVLSSGRIMAGGYAREGSNYLCWIVKIDNNGCMDTLFCQTSALHEAPETKAGLRVYPNPATQTQVRIEAPEKIASVELSDLSGRLLTSYPAPGSTGVTLQLPALLPAGVYIITVRYVRGGVSHRRLFVE